MMPSDKPIKLIVDDSQSKDAEAANQLQFLIAWFEALPTPINAIIGYSEMLQEEMEELNPSDFDAEKFNLSDFINKLGRISTAGKQLLEIKNHAYDFAKIQSNQVDINLETIELEKWLYEIEAAIKSRMVRQSNLFQLHIVNHLGEIYADSNKIRQILCHLVSHSLKFTRKGTIRLEVMRQTVGTAEWINFQLNDNGFRLTPELYKKRYLFTAADISHTRFNGTDLWLIMAQSLTEMMGGYFTIDHISEKGSKFTVRLPVTVRIEEESFN